MTARIDLIKYCESCGEQLIRREFPCGRRETADALRKRRFCNGTCRWDKFRKDKEPKGKTLYEVFKKEDERDTVQRKQKSSR